MFESSLALGSASGSPTDELPPRNLGRLLGETFGIYRRNFWPLVIIATIPLGVVFLALVIPVLDAVLWLVGGFLCMIAFGATVYAVVQQYVTQRVDIVGSYRRAFSKSIYLLVALIIPSLLLFSLVLSFLGAVLVWGGILLLTLGGYEALPGTLGILFGISMLLIGGLIGPIALYFVVIWLWTPYAIIVKNKGPIAGFRLSGALVSGRWWRTFGMGLVLLLTTLLIMLLPMLMLKTIGLILVIGSMGAIGLGCALYSLVFPIIPIGSTLVYLDLRVRNEGYTLQQMATELRR